LIRNCGFQTPGVNFPSVSHSNISSISHVQKFIGDFHIRDLEIALQGHLRSKVMMHFY